MPVAILLPAMLVKNCCKKIYFLNFAGRLKFNFSRSIISEEST
jgi:hypothetical protein